MTLQAKRKRRGRKAFLGLVFVLLAAVGIVTIAMLGTKVVSDVFDNRSEKQKLERFIQPLLMLDPPPFDSVDKADNILLLQASMWATIINAEKTKYSYDDWGMMVVPATDVNVYCAKLFGDGVELIHQTFGDFSISFLYNPDTRCYSVPATGIMALYTPQIEKIEKDGATYNLLVGYIPPGMGWEQVGGNSSSPDPDKYMTYIVEYVGRNPRIIAVKDVPSNQSSQAPDDNEQPATTPDNDGIFEQPATTPEQPDDLGR